MSRPSLSRVHFITGGAAIAGSALVAACSSGSSLVPTRKTALHADPNLADLRIPATHYKTALGHEGFQLSSNKAGSAVAAHTSAGEFIGSFAVGSAFTRTRVRERVIIAPTELPFQQTWFYVKGGGRFKYKQLKSGRHGILVVDKDGQRALIHKQDGFLHIRHQNRTAQKVWLGEMDSKVRLLNPRADFNKSIDNPGIWTGDDDLRERERTFRPMGDIHLHPSHTYCPDDPASGDCGDSGDSGGDGFGDGDGIITGPPPLPPGGGKPTPHPIARPSVKVSCPPGTTMTTECWWDLAGLAAAALLLVGAGLGAIAACFVGGAFTFGIACLGAILGLIGTSEGLATAWHAYTSNNCPIPTKGHGC